MTCSTLTGKPHIHDLRTEVIRVLPCHRFSRIHLGYAISMPEFKEKPVSDRFRNFRDTILLTLNRMVAIEKARTFGTEPSPYGTSLSIVWWCALRRCTRFECLCGLPRAAQTLDRPADTNTRPSSPLFATEA